jgi:hypothetical protein
LRSQSLTTWSQHWLVAFEVAAGAADAAGAPAMAHTAATRASAPKRLVHRLAFVVGIVVSRAPYADEPNVRPAIPVSSLPNPGVLAVWPM